MLVRFLLLRVIVLALLEIYAPLEQQHYVGRQRNGRFTRLFGPMAVSGGSVWVKRSRFTGRFLGYAKGTGV
jgi:hypothetical protein